MDRLSIDTQLLVSTGTVLRTIATEFEHADTRADDLSDVVGNENLADAVHDFSHSWNDRRAKILESMQGLAESCTNVGEAFEDLDSQLAGALTGSAS